MEEFVNNIQGIYGLGFIKRLQGPAWELVKRDQMLSDE